MAVLLQPTHLLSIHWQLEKIADFSSANPKFPRNLWNIKITNELPLAGIKLPFTLVLTQNI